MNFFEYLLGCCIKLKVTFRSYASSSGVFRPSIHSGQRPTLEKLKPEERQRNRKLGNNKDVGCAMLVSRKVASSISYVFMCTQAYIHTYILCLILVYCLFFLPGKSRLGILIASIREAPAERDDAVPPDWWSGFVWLMRMEIKVEMVGKWLTGDCGLLAKSLLLSVLLL